MSKDLDKLVERARATQMRPVDREQQRRSFAYGNTHFENPDITREIIDRQATLLEKDNKTNPEK